MRPKWTIGLAIGLFLLYISYFGVAGIGLTLFPSRTTNLQAGMSWTSTETFGSSYTYTVTSILGSVVTIRQIGTMIEGGSPFPIDQLDVFDVTNTANATSYYEPQVVASGLGIEADLFQLGYPPYGPIHGYVSTIETVAGKNLLVSNWSYTNGAGVTIKFTTKYYQDSGVEYSSVEFDPPGWTPFIRYQCTSSDPVSGVPPNYHIVASSGIGGSISPSGSVTVTSGGSQSFTITANGGYQISNVLIDGSSQGAISSYSFTNVQADHTISAQFTLANGTTYTITASAGVGGSIIPLGNVIVNAGSSQSFTITSNNGYRISGILVDGISVGGVSSYTFTNVQTSHGISASFLVMPNPPPDYLVYLMIFLDALLGNSRLMLLVGASITLISGIMLFWPKPTPQYHQSIKRSICASEYFSFGRVMTMGRPGLLTIGCVLEGLDGLLFLLAALGVGVLTALVGAGSVFSGGWIGMVVATMGGGSGTFALLCGVEGLLCLAGAYGLWTGKNWGRLIVTGLGLPEILGVAYTFSSGGIDFITPIIQGIVLGYLWLSKDVKRFLK